MQNAIEPSTETTDERVPEYDPDFDRDDSQPGLDFDLTDDDEENQDDANR